MNTNIIQGIRVPIQGEPCQQIHRYYFKDSTELLTKYGNQTLRLVLPYSESEMTDEILARGIRVLKRKLAEEIAKEIENEIKFELITCEAG